MKKLVEKVNWYLKRARMMSLQELLFFRVKQLVQALILDLIDSVTYKPNEDSLKDGTIKFEYRKESIDKLLDSFDFSLEYRFFDVVIPDLSKIDSWRQDPKTGKISPKRPSPFIKRQDMDQYGDFKYVVELSRFHHLPFIALKSVSSDQDVYSNLIENQLTAWESQNPYLMSIQWTSGMEVSIRAINLIYTYLILKSFGKLNDRIKGVIRRQILFSYRYLQNHLSLYSSANNHLIAELSAILIISAYFSDAKFIKRKWGKHFNHFIHELNNQFNLDGVNFELSTRYHAEVVDLVLNAARFMEHSTLFDRDKIIPKVQLMFGFIGDSLSQENIVTEFGDSDNGHLIFPYFQQDFNLYRSILQSGCIHFNNPATINLGKFDLRNYLIYGEPAFKRYGESRLKPIERKSKLYEHSGYGFFYHDKVKLAIDVGRIGDHLMAAHGHSDLMHFILEKNGFQYLIDSGTYQYHEKSSFWRRYFKGISSHNTISVNNLNQAVYNNRMSWVDTPEISGLRFKETSDRIKCEASHNGFLKQGVNVIHRREFCLEKNQNSLIISDQLIGTGSHSFSFYLHFNPRLQSVKLKEGMMYLVKSDKEVLRISNERFTAAILYYGDSKKPLGWYSNTYGTKEKTWSLELAGTFENQIKLDTVFHFENA